jgi:hypothetical protein
MLSYVMKKSIEKVVAQSPFKTERKEEISEFLFNKKERTTLLKDNELFREKSVFSSNMIDIIVYHDFTKWELIYKRDDKTVFTMNKYGSEYRGKFYPLNETKQKEPEVTIYKIDISTIKIKSKYNPWG